MPRQEFDALTQPKPLMNLWRALISAIDTEFKLSKKILSIILNLPRAGQLQSRCSIVFNFSSYQHALQ